MSTDLQTPGTGHKAPGTRHQAVDFFAVARHQAPGTRHQSLGTKYGMVSYTQPLEQSINNEPQGSINNQRFILPLEPDFNIMYDPSIDIEPAITTW